MVQPILLKITGEAFLDPVTKSPTVAIIMDLVEQIKRLSATHTFGIVVGGGNFFRGDIEGKVLDLSPSYAHYIGMLATMMNGLVIKNSFEKQSLTSTMLCALPCSEVGATLSQQAIADALQNGTIIIFTGGTGNPFFSTDTTAILRGLQMRAVEVWKGTKVNGIYSADPMQDTTAELIPQLTYKEAIDKRLGIMDTTAFALAEREKMPIRVFNIFEKDALIQAAHNPNFGSRIRL